MVSFQPPTMTTPAQPNQPLEFLVEPKKPWNATGFQLIAGHIYHLRSNVIHDQKGSCYRDKNVTCNPNGPVGFKGWLLDWLARDARCPLNPANWFGPGKIKRLRVLEDFSGTRASFLTVIGAIGYDDSRENVFVIGCDRTITAPASGELVVFCNDWPGGPGTTGDDRFKNSKSYFNNKGLIKLTIEAVVNNPPGTIGNSQPRKRRKAHKEIGLWAVVALMLWSFAFALPFSILVGGHIIAPLNFLLILAGWLAILAMLTRYENLSRVVRTGLSIAIPIVLTTAAYFGLQAKCHLHSFGGVETNPHPAIAQIQSRLTATVHTLAADYGARHVYQKDQRSLSNTFGWIVRELAQYGDPEMNGPGCLIPSDLIRKLPDALAVSATNIVFVKTGTTSANDIIIVGAHYDTVPFTTDWQGTETNQFRPRMRGTPGANDNASGVAALIEIARQLKPKTLNRTIRYIAFANEEPPNFECEASMGSRIYARQCRTNKDNILMMISLDTMGVYSRLDANSKRISAANLFGLNRNTNYVVFMSNWNAGSGRLAARWAKVFSSHSTVNVRTCSLPFIKGEIFAWSDDWSFTREDYPAFTVTDSAFYRSDRYHELWDTPENLSQQDYEVFARVVLGLAEMIAEMANN